MTEKFTFSYVSAFSWANNFMGFMGCYKKFFFLQLYTVKGVKGLKGLKKLEKATLQPYNCFAGSRNRYLFKIYTKFVLFHSIRQISQHIKQHLLQKNVNKMVKRPQKMIHHQILNFIKWIFKKQWEK
jgi:hypothetical protein